MTDSVRGSHGPPWSVDLLADLHAGVLDPDESARLWPMVNADPEARAVLEALDSVKVGLGQLGSAPVEPMPAQFAARLDAALAAEMQAVRARGPVATATQRISQPAPPTTQPSVPPAGPVIDLAAARKRRNRMAGWGAGVLTAAAAAAAIAFVAFPGNTTDGSPQAGDNQTDTEQPDGSAPPPLALSSDNLAPAIGELTGDENYGPLKDEAGLRECLSTLGVDAGSTFGVSPVTFDGEEAVAALLGAGTGTEGQFRLVVMTPTCDDELSNTMLPN